MNDQEREVYEKAKRLVDHEVYLNMSNWIDWSYKVAADQNAPMTDCPVDLEDVPSALECGECNGTGHELCNKGDCQEDDCECTLEYPQGSHTALRESLWSVTGTVCSECDDGQIMVEIFEWWAVSKYLGAKLADRGEVVLEGEYWGRQTTGQAVAMDAAVQEIAAELNA